MLGHDAHDGKRVQKRVIRLRHGNFHMRVVGRRSLFDHGKVGLGRLGFDDAVNSERYVGCGQRLSVGELCVVANGEIPGHSIVCAVIFRSKVVDELEIGVRGDEGGLDQGLMHMLAAAPRHEGVEAGGRFAVHVHGNDDLVLRLGITCRRAFVGTLAPACGKHAGACDARASGGDQLRKTAAGHIRGKC